jgi:hypothetical protein
VNEDLKLEATWPDDPRLPKPRGATRPRAKEDEQEKLRLEMTKRFGGLLPEQHNEPQSWQCGQCGKIFTDRQLAFACCGTGPNRVQVCLRCHARSADCRCVLVPWRSQ